MWGWTELAGPQGLLGAGVVGWSVSGSRTLGPLCVCCLQPAYFPQSLPRNISPACLAKLFKKSFRCFFFFSIETNPHSACCWVFTSANYQPLRSAPTLAITPRVSLLVWGTTFILVFGSLVLYLQQSWLLQVLPTWKSCCREVPPRYLCSFSSLYWLHTNHLFQPSHSPTCSPEVLDGRTWA